MENEKIKLDFKLLSKDKSDLFKQSQFREDNKEWIRNSQAVALKILLKLREQNISKKKELSENLSIHIEEVNKYLKGNKKFDLETINKIENYLEINLK